MRREQRSMLVLTIIIAFIVTVVCLPGMIDAGSLDPVGPPGPTTMKTLEDIYNLVVEVREVMGFPEIIESVGSLDPPSTAVDTDGDPVPTMKTVDDIYSLLDPIYQCDLEFLPTGFVLWEENPRFAICDFNNTSILDDLVLDRATDLIWTRDSYWNGYHEWEDACNTCGSFAFGGRADWRLPGSVELASLTGQSSSGPQMEDPFNWQQGGGRFWSTDAGREYFPGVGYQDCYWTVVYSGEMFCTQPLAFTKAYVWCVHDAY